LNLSSDEAGLISISGFLTICRRGRNASRPVIFLHGSSGNETSLANLAVQTVPDHPCYFPRGREKDNQAFAFFRREADRSINTTNLASRCQELASVLLAITEQHGKTPHVIGFSSGAVMAAALLAEHADLVAGAVLLRPEPPYGARAFDPLAKRPALLIAGEHDPRRRPSDATNLAALLTSADADVELHSLPCGHALGASDMEITRAWLSRRG
jgi:phospholipase/carboxylesterase